MLTDLVGKMVGSDQFLNKFVACQTLEYSSVYLSSFIAYPIKVAMKDVPSPVFDEEVEVTKAR